MSDFKILILNKLKSELIEQVSVAEVDVGEVNNQDSIFGPTSKLELDSLDALELVMLLERNFDIKLKGKASSTVIFKNFDVLGDYILENTSKETLEEYLKD